MSEEIKEKISSKKNTYIYTIGRRKQASARVRLYQEIKSTYDFKKGDIIVNSKKIEEYFPSELEKLHYLDPLKVLGLSDKLAFTIRVSGGGMNSQLDAVILGMSRALAKIDSEKHKGLLRKKGFLTTDARVRERRKVGTGGKARRKKQSPKR
ncbi:MAG: 30S ribosomal protein S9 [Patescibacteria group bacterium]